MSINLGPKIPIMVSGAVGDGYLTQGNALLRALQPLLMANVISLAISAPPPTPTNGDTYVVAGGGSGAWTGKDTQIAYWSTDNLSTPSGEWEFFVPAKGWIVANQLDGNVYIFNGAAWVGISALYGSHGESWVEGSTTEEITLSNAATTTDSVADLLPVNSIILAVVARVTVTITALATVWKIGDPTTANRFTSNDATLTAGETQVGLNHWHGGVASDAAGPTQQVADKIRITTDAIPGAGKVRVTVFYRQYIAPTS